MSPGEPAATGAAAVAGRRRPWRRGLSDGVLGGRLGAPGTGPAHRFAARGAPRRAAKEAGFGSLTPDFRFGHSRDQRTLVEVHLF